MHENRETSEASRLNQSRDRPEKALRRTAGRHVSEESDCAIVPVNLSNKEEQSSAERGEGAGQGEHRSVQHEPDTERGTSVTGAARCASGSKRKEAGTVHCFAPPCDG